VTTVDRDALHRLIDGLPDEKLVELVHILQQSDKTLYEQTPSATQIKERVVADYRIPAEPLDEAGEKQEPAPESELAWLNQLSAGLRFRLLIELVMMIHRQEQVGNWIEVTRTLKRWKVIAQCPDGLDPDISIEQEEAAAKMAIMPPPLIPVYVPHIPAVTDLPFEIFKQLRRDTSPINPPN
jgi:hypothetical protein